MNEFAAVMPITHRPAIVFDRGEGDWLWDEQGRMYLDFVQGWAVNCLGHSPAALATALTRQAQRLINPSPAFYNRPMVELAGHLTRRSGLDQVFFANSGAEANEGAIKLARKWGARHREGAFEIITTHNSFHGRTLATMSATGKPQWEPLFEPKVPGFVKVPFNDLAAVKAAVTDRTVAVMLEPVQGEGGVVPARRDYLEGLRRLTREEGILLILDEVQTGIGRLGSLFGHETFAVEPDVLTLGKGLGGGVPISALLTKARFSCFEPGEQGGTFGGTPLVTAVAGAVLEVVDRPEFLAGVREKGDRLRQELAVLSDKYGLGAVRGIGLLNALNTGSLGAPAIVQAALARGLLLNAPRPDILRFMPALNVEVDSIERMIALLQSAIEDVAD